MAAPREPMFPDLPGSVLEVLRALSAHGHDVALVGGAVRDRLVGSGRHVGDWDVATSALPDEIAAIFPDHSWDNRFGTVTVIGDPSVEITSHRTEGAYRDRRRPDEVQFGASLPDDLARRDFTINAIAWVPDDVETGNGRIVDPFDGLGDLERRVLRAVGDPAERFAEDALRLVRAARFTGRFELALDPATEAAMTRLAPTAATVSAERVRDELLRMMDDPAPSHALRVLERTGILAVVLPEVAALRGVPQAKAVPGDALEHSYRAVDAAPAGDRTLRLAALLHDLGKATTLADGHFIGHEQVGAEMVEPLLRRLRVPRAMAEPVVRAIRQHMYAYDAGWSDAAVRRFIRRVGEDDLALLFALRRADDAASGVAESGATAQAELERRIATELSASPDLLRRRRLAIDGDDLQRELGIPPGPRIGMLMEALTEAVLDDPALNRPDELIGLARRIDADAVTAGTNPEPRG